MSTSLLNIKSAKERKKRVKSSKISSPESKEDEIPEKVKYNINEFKRIYTLGTGTFGNVILVKNMNKNKHCTNFENEEYYALKVLNKRKVVHYKQEEHTLNERKILSRISHMFIVKLLFSFQDNANLYMGLEFVNGGELFSYLKKRHKIDEDEAKFYASQVFLALEYLHELKIIYRDLKPENILIDLQGYIKITDFGFAKFVETRTYTLCGTPEYLAPELIQNRGYNQAVDWWAFGILIYEMVIGAPPFVDNIIIEIYKKIVEGEFKIPAFLSKDLKHLIMGLIMPDITIRLGNMKKGSEDIRKHDWFKLIQWDNILNKKIIPNYIPKVDSVTDTKYFDKYEDEEIEKSSILLYEEKFKDF